MAKKKPILFNTEMVKAILDKRKTQTRRVVGDKLLNEIYKNDCYIDDGQIFESCMCQGMPDGSGGLEVDRWEEDVTTTYSKYKVGDILWVRETLKTFSNITMNDEVGVIYKADNKEVILPCNRDYECEYVFNDNWKPSIHMPKKYARIFLKVANVRVERLQDISDEDCIKEGITEVGFYPDDGFPLCSGYMIGEDDGKTPLANTPQKPFVNLWNSTSKDGYKWEDNPYVFVYEFERVEK